ncbi:MAG: polymer-forming cytoskeletal protein, partial [Gemmatimonadetes bacterium]|nr:polymer-forming cytoskeletal protein [Gemmatimonadota bacterium]
LQSTCRIDGEIFVRRMQLEEGAILNGRIHMGEVKAPDLTPSKPSTSAATNPPPKSAPQPATAGKA